MSAKNGGQAFPSGEGVDYEPGMTLRDWFAGQALAGLCVGESDSYRLDGRRFTADAAYKMADAMLEARK